MTGGEDEVRRLFEAEYPRLRAWSTALCGDAAAGEDIAQESFTRLLSRMTGVMDPRAYVYTVAANLINDRWRAMQRRRTLVAFLARTAQPSAPAADGSVRDLISRLPDRQRIAVLLHYYGGLPVSEVANHMHKPAGTVRRWLAEARATLRTELEDVR